MSNPARQQSSARKWESVLTAASLVLVGLLGATPAVADELASQPTAAVDRGVVITEAGAETPTCAVTDGTLDWGFKESFRSYISSSIANGKWVVADGATYETPLFGWDGGAGSYDGESAQGVVAFLGSVKFTGHGGVLNTVVANPQLRFDGDSLATLLLDVSGTTQQGNPVSALAVEFATIDLSAGSVTDGEFLATDAPAVLTADGAAAFGTYPEGEELDPLTVAFPVDPACVGPVVPTDDGATVDPENTSSASPIQWWVWLIGAVLLLAIAAAVVLLVRRRNATS